MRILHRRDDDTLVVEIDGLPFHMLKDDPRWPAAFAAAVVLTLPPEPPPPSPVRPDVQPVVSVRALLRALTAMGFINRAEALAAARTGDIPASLRAPLFAAVDEDTAFEIELAWAAMYEAERASPFWGYVVAAGIATEAQIDAVFALAAQS